MEAVPLQRCTYPVRILATEQELIALTQDRVTSTHTHTHAGRGQPSCRTDGDTAQPQSSVCSLRLPAVLTSLKKLTD
jgi:hypothetical protein